VAKPVAASAKSGAGKVRTDATGSCPGGAVSCTSGTSVRPSADPLGVTDDDFPAGGQFPVGWTTPPGADAGWIVASDFANQGTFSLKSATITHEQWAVTQVAGVFAAGTVSFAYRVSSEPGFDSLEFYIDGVAQGLEASGEVGWNTVSYPVAAGAHVLRWEYSKDSSDSEGADAAWIDTVVLPPGTTLMLLNVAFAGSGAGRVTSVPEGLDCTDSCAVYVIAGTTVTLNAAPEPGTAFIGWSGDCAAAPCTVTMDDTRNVTATFSTPDDYFPPGGQMPVGWTTTPGADAGWVVASDSANAGLYSLKSAPIGNAQSAAIQVAATFLAGNVTFAYRVSSEIDFDFLEFYIDDVLRFSATGIGTWAQESFAIPAGPHVLKWVYVKDVSASEGADAAWIDSVVLPLDPLSLGTLDVDASLTGTRYDALTDGLLIIRYLRELTGTSLTGSALGSTATRTDTDAIKAYLDGIRPALDVDDDGTKDPLTDGLLIMRYLFGLRDGALIAGAVGPLAQRNTADAIEAYLQALMP